MYPEVRKSIVDAFKRLTAEELARSLDRLTIEVGMALNAAKKKYGALSRKEYDLVTGLKASTREEYHKLDGVHDVKLSVLLKILEPFGYTLSVVPMKEQVGTPLPPEIAEQIAKGIKLSVTLEK